MALEPANPDDGDCGIVEGRACDTGSALRHAFGHNLLTARAASSHGARCSHTPHGSSRYWSRTTASPTSVAADFPLGASRQRHCSTESGVRTPILPTYLSRPPQLPPRLPSAQPDPPPQPPHIAVWRSVRRGDTRTRKSRRTLALPARCVEALWQQLEDQGWDRLAADDAREEHGLVVSSVRRAPSARRSRASTGSTPTSRRLGSPGTASCRCSPARVSRWRRSSGLSAIRVRPWPRRSIGSRSGPWSRLARWSWTGSWAPIRNGSRHPGSDSHADRRAAPNRPGTYSREQVPGLLFWLSGWRDLNPRPLRPERRVRRLPTCK
ncbi:hypothetical protein SAMN05216533_3894 [Streptomyces sp. Ag109_O5-10]|nr:hypothetical protein SAMN05216533_3894 [Streptomyces sp. Ag109_O5-10]